jgi:hypothetical protein
MSIAGRIKGETTDERKIFVSDDGTHYVFKRDTDMRINTSMVDNHDVFLNSNTEKSFAGEESADI